MRTLYKDSNKMILKFIRLEEIIRPGEKRRMKCPKCGTEMKRIPQEKVIHFSCPKCDYYMVVTRKKSK